MEAAQLAHVYVKYGTDRDFRNLKDSGSYDLKKNENEYLSQYMKIRHEYENKVNSQWAHNGITRLIL
jgi:hypothetical protein